MAIILSIDVGTTKLCTLALSLRTLRPLAVHAAVHDADVAGLPAGRHEQSAARIRDRVWESLACLLAERAVQREDVVGVSLTGQMHGLLLVDRDLRPVTNLVSWRDQRVLLAGQPGCLDDARRAIGPGCAARTGCGLHAGYGGATLWHWARNDSLPPDVAAMTIADFIAASLTGVVATDPTHAASWGLFHLSRGGWDAELIRRLRLPAAVLPPIRPSSSVLGNLRVEHARALGLRSETRVYVPVGDNQASIVGAAGLARDAAVVNLGTGGQVSIPRSAATWVEGWETRPMPFGGYVLVGASLCGGWSYAYLRRFFQEVVRQFAGVQLDDDRVYERMNQLAAAAPAGAAGLWADTRFQGTRGDPARRGAVSGMDADNLTAGNLTRALLEGLVRELAEMFHAVDNAGVRRIVASGNAVRKNRDLVVETIAALFGRECRASRDQEEAALGAAYAAAVGEKFVSPQAVPPHVE